MTIVSVDEVAAGGLPLVVCVSSDPGVRERVVGQLGGAEIVLICPDLRALRTLLGAVGPVSPLTVGTPVTAVAPIDRVTQADPADPFGSAEPAAAPAPSAHAQSVPAATRPTELVFDPRDHRLLWRGTALPLTRLESELVVRLGHEPVRVWTYEKLFTAVWGGAYLGDNAILHSAVKRLRRKLRDVGQGLSIETVRGIGYRLITG